MVHNIVTCLLYFPPIVLSRYIPSPRWAQAVALLESTLYVHGGLSDPFNSYSYTAAPETSDLLVLDLSASFNSSSPPWQLFSSNTSPALAWHTLSAFSSAELLIFGGQPGLNSSTVLTTLNDSSTLLVTSNKSNPSFYEEPQSWAHQPMRRIRHSTSYTNERVWIIGGEKADGSGNAFSEHYSFVPSGPDFVQLPPSSNAPPDIYGHASLVLPDGRLLVLGGYCASCSELVPMDTVWTLDTSQNPPVWEMPSISNGSLPDPRRDFAAVVLSSGQVLIHGGGDAQLQETYSDGWILDTSQNPMVWSSVTALTQLGQRKDHFAVQTGGYVLFCFGYGSSSPAPASLFIYDPTASSMVTSYTAPSPGSTLTITSLPVPMQTGSNPNSDGGIGTTSGGSSSSHSYPPASSSGSSSYTIAIALGTIFGILALVACALAIIYYLKRLHGRNRRAARRFFPLAEDPEGPEGSVGSAAPEAAHGDSQTNKEIRGVDIPGVITDILAHLGVNKFSSRPRQPRKDMFADEDTRSFGWVGYSSTRQRQGNEAESVWSLHSVSALVRGVMSREPSGPGVDQGNHGWEKIDHLREGREDLIRQRSLESEYFSHPIHRRDASFWSYTGPHEDPLQDDEYDNLNLRPGTPEKDADYDDSLPTSDETDDFESTALAPQDSDLPFSVRACTLIPLREDPHTSLSDPWYSLPLRQECSCGKLSVGQADNAALSTTPSTSPTLQSPTVSCLSDLHPVTSVVRYSTVSGSTLSHSPSSSRPDNWWSRLTKSPLLDRRTSITSSKPLDFRDPTPAPPLVLLEKTKKCCTPARSNDTPTDTSVGHSRSLSSAHSGRTANTDSAEHLSGSYDVVQRLASDGSSSRSVPSLGSAEVTEQGISVVDNDGLAEICLSNSPLRADPPRSATVPAAPVMSKDVGTLSGSPVSLKPMLAFSENGGIVNSRVKAYERKLSQELEPQQLSPPRNTGRREVPSRMRPTVHYGVAPRASLFVANPDLRHVS